MDPNSVAFWQMVILGLPGIIARLSFRLLVTAPRLPITIGIMTQSRKIYEQSHTKTAQTPSHTRTETQRARYRKTDRQKVS